MIDLDAIVKYLTGNCDAGLDLCPYDGTKCSYYVVGAAHCAKRIRRALLRAAAGESREDAELGRLWPNGVHLVRGSECAHGSNAGRFAVERPGGCGWLWRDTPEEALRAAAGESREDGELGELGRLVRRMPDGWYLQHNDPEGWYMVRLTIRVPGNREVMSGPEDSPEEALRAALGKGESGEQEDS